MLNNLADFQTNFPITLSQIAHFVDQFANRRSEMLFFKRRFQGIIFQVRRLRFRRPRPKLIDVDNPDGDLRGSPVELRLAGM